MERKEFIWVDFENAPQVWVLSSVIRRLSEKGIRFQLTARDFSYTVGLCQRIGFEAKVIGTSRVSKNKIGKAVRIVIRGIQLALLMRPHRKRVNIVLSCGSRSQLIAARLLGIPAIILADYEYADLTLNRLARYILVPFPIPKDMLGTHKRKIVHYPGLKEELHLYGFQPSPGLPEALKSYKERVLVLFRPESRTAHYASKQSIVLHEAILSYLSGFRNIVLIIFPRDEVQKRFLNDWCKKKNISFWFPGIVDGPDLISKCDLVIGGGGSMTREAAILGVPSYSFFSGQWGAVDRYLESQRRLVKISLIEDVEKIVLKKWNKVTASVPADALNFVARFIEDRITQ